MPPNNRGGGELAALHVLATSTTILASAGVAGWVPRLTSTWPSPSRFHLRKIAPKPCAQAVGAFLVGQLLFGGCAPLERMRGLKSNASITQTIPYPVSRLVRCLGVTVP